MALLARYEFNDNWEDTSGNAKHGTLFGNCKIIDNCGFGKAAYFPGIGGNYIRLAAKIVPDSEAGYGFTFSCWVYPLQRSPDSTADKTFMNVDFLYSADEGFMLRMNSDNQIRTYWGNVSRIWNAGIPNNKWSHVCVTVDWGGPAYLYIDGQYIENTAAITGWKNDPEGTNTGRIGAEDSIHPFKGYIDEVRIYSGLMDSNEVLALYQELGTPTDPPRINLGGGWVSDERKKKKKQEDPYKPNNVATRAIQRIQTKIERLS